jgi:hypothetical protein
MFCNIWRVCASALHLADCIDRCWIFIPRGRYSNLSCALFVCARSNAHYIYIRTRCGPNIIMQMSQVIDWRRKHKQLGAWRRPCPAVVPQFALRCGTRAREFKWWIRRRRELHDWRRCPIRNTLTGDSICGAKASAAWRRRMQSRKADVSSTLHNNRVIFAFETITGVFLELIASLQVKINFN